MYSNKTATIDQYIRRLSGQEKEPQNVDHNYMKNWSSHPDSHRTKPAKMLFMNILPRYSQKRMNMHESDEEVDVDTPDIPFISPFDTPKSKSIANDVERSLKMNPHFIDVDRSENEDVLENCTFQQRRIYNSVIQVLNADILARNIYSGHPHESLKKRISTEKYSKELRLVFANNFYDFDLIFWVHKIILEETAFSTVVSYLNLLQAMCKVIPSIIDKIVKHYSGSLGEEFLSLILKRHWDPVTPTLNQHKPKKLSYNPFLLISCVGLDSEQSSRVGFLTTHLNALCKTVYVPLVSDDGAPVKKTVESVVEVAITSMKNKINELKNHFPDRPIIVGGWTIGAVIACHVALEMPVEAVICFGFPLTGVNGSRGDLDDPLLNSSKPTLFIVGQNASMCSIDDIEDFRSRMSGETGLVVVGGADDYLLIPPMKMLEEKITQAIVDRCILDEIGDFVQAALVKLPSTSSSIPSSISKSCRTIMEVDSAESDQEGERKRKRRRPKEYSPELYPSRKRFRDSVSKEVPCIPSRSRLSPSSSETLSSGSFRIEKPIAMKAAARNPEKRGVGRPPGSTSKKKPSIKLVVKPILKPIPKPTIKPIVKPTPETDKGESPVKSAFRNDLDLPFFNLVTLPKLPSPKKSEPSIPFALNILPKKNDPVDVGAAFGKDSSFLPRPLTPPELEAILSAKRTEKASAESEKAATELKQDAVELKTTLIPASEPLKVQSIGSANPQPNTLSVSEKSIMPLAEQPSSTAGGPKVVPASIIKPILTSAPGVKKRIAVTVASPSFKTVFHQGKGLHPSSVAQLKNISGMNLIGSSISQTNTINTAKAMITVPSSSATILLNASTLKTPSGKVVKLLSKGHIALKKKDPLTLSSIVDGSASPIVNRSPDPQVCNLSLLSDVAGMTKPLKDTGKAEPISSSATLVKLAVPDKSNAFRHIQVLKALQSCSAVPSTSRIDTPEEMAEKQFAIQALNRSIGADSSAQPAKESGYSICFAKPDGSILSRAVPKTSNAAYIRQSLLPQISVRGKSRSVVPRMNFYKR